MKHVHHDASTIITRLIMQQHPPHRLQAQAHYHPRVPGHVHFPAHPPPTGCVGRDRRGPKSLTINNPRRPSPPPATRGGMRNNARGGSCQCCSSQAIIIVTLRRWANSNLPFSYNLQKLYCDCFQRGKVRWYSF